MFKAIGMDIAVHPYCGKIRTSTGSSRFPIGRPWESELPGIYSDLLVGPEILDRVTGHQPCQPRKQHGSHPFDHQTHVVLLNSANAVFQDEEEN